MTRSNPRPGAKLAASIPAAVLFPDSSWRNPLQFQILPKQTKRAKDAQLYGGDRNAQRLGDFLVRALLDDGEGGGDPQRRAQSSEGQSRLAADLLRDGRIARRRNRQIGEEIAGRGVLGLQRAEPIESRMSGDAACPWLESALRIEALPRAVDAPERFDGELVGSCWIADDAQNPSAYRALVQPEQGFEGVVARFGRAMTELDQGARLIHGRRFHRVAGDVPHRALASVLLLRVDRGEGYTGCVLRALPGLIER